MQLNNMTTDELLRSVHSDAEASELARELAARLSEAEFEIEDLKDHTGPCPHCGE